jgi:hypothetical protein
MKSILRPPFRRKGPRCGMKRVVAASCSIFLIFLFLHCSAIVSFALTVISPNGGEILASGVDWNIEWDSPEGATTFTVFYSINNGATWKLISENVTEPVFAWTVPSPRGNKGKCLVKVEAYNSKGRKIASDRSDGPFKIEVVRLISPDGGEVLGTGDINLISWQVNKTASEVSQIVLYYSQNDGVTWRVITREVPIGSSDFDWKVPRVVNNVSLKTRVKIVLKDLRGKILGSDQSNGPFTMTNGEERMDYTGDLTFWVDSVYPGDGVTTEDWASFYGPAYGSKYFAYDKCPSAEPLKGFWMKGKNLTSGMAPDYISHGYWATCGYFWCYCDQRWTADFSLVMGYNIISISAHNYEGHFTRVLETIKRIPLALTGIAVAPGNGQNTITWDDVPEATSYNVYWSETYPVTKAEANRIPRVLSPYIHSGLTNGKTYYYMVTSAAANVESDESWTVSGTPE